MLMVFFQCSTDCDIRSLVVRMEYNFWDRTADCRTLACVPYACVIFEEHMVGLVLVAFCQPKKNLLQHAAQTNIAKCERATLVVKKEGQDCLVQHAFQMPDGMGVCMAAWWRRQLASTPCHELMANYHQLVAK